MEMITLSSSALVATSCFSSTLWHQCWSSGLCWADHVPEGEPHLC